MTEKDKTIGMVHAAIKCMRDEIGEQVEIQAFELFLRIALHPGESQNSLADQLNVSFSTISRNVERLRKRGLVKRAEDPQDRRIKVMSLTAKGERTIDKIREEAKRPTVGAV